MRSHQSRCKEEMQCGGGAVAGQDTEQAAPNKVSGLVREMASQLLLKRLVHRLPHDDFDLVPETGRQRLGVFQNQPAYCLAQQPVQRQVDTLHHAVHHLLLQPLDVRCGRARQSFGNGHNRRGRGRNHLPQGGHKAGWRPVHAFSPALARSCRFRA